MYLACYKLQMIIAIRREMIITNEFPLDVKLLLSNYVIFGSSLNNTCEYLLYLFVNRRCRCSYQFHYNFLLWHRSETPLRLLTVLLAIFADEDINIAYG